VLGSVNNIMEGWKYLANVSDKHEADIVESMLGANGIPVYRKHREGGDYMTIYTGTSLFGIDIFVPADQLDTAKGLLEYETHDIEE
jgi:hypothetical protein